MRVGLAGIGFMGWIHYLAYQRSERGKLVAFSSGSTQKRSGDWRGIQGNFGPPGEQIDVGGMNVYRSLDSMLNDDQIDLVDICLPTQLHEQAIRKCLSDGKRVLCEKPLALNATTARELAAAAAPGQLMVAHVLPWIPEFKLLVDAKADGRWGKPISARFKRTISPPDWNPDFFDASKVGGPLIDLHVHDAHLLRVLFGMPVKAHTARRMNGDVAARYETVFEFADPNIVVSSGGGIIESAARPFNHAYEVSFENATVQFEFAALADGKNAGIPLTVMHRDGRIERPAVGSGDSIEAFVRQINAVADCIDSGRVATVLDAQTAADALQICEMQMG